MPTSEALSLAEVSGLDLVEVAPAASPPVCRLLDYGKFRYEASRREREARKQQRARTTNVLREVRFKTRIGAHDRASKVRHIKRLLGEGSKVKVSVMFRGREITHPELGMTLLRSVAEELVDEVLMESPPRMSGRFLTMILAPGPVKPQKSTEPEKSADQEKIPEPKKALDHAKA